MTFDLTLKENLHDLLAKTAEIYEKVLFEESFVANTVATDTILFDEGAIMKGQKLQQVELTRQAMLENTQKRKSLFEAKLKPTIEVIFPQSTPDMLRPWIFQTLT